MGARVGCKIDILHKFFSGSHEQPANLSYFMALSQAQGEGDERRLGGVEAWRPKARLLDLVNLQHPVRSG